jgi:hypothetical protein
MDLTKDAFRVNGVDSADCLIGMEVNGSAHYRAWALHRQGYAVGIVSTVVVKGRVKGDKSDAAIPRRSARRGGSLGTSKGNAPCL